MNKYFCKITLQVSEPSASDFGKDFDEPEGSFSYSLCLILVTNFTGIPWRISRKCHEFHESVTDITKLRERKRQIIRYVRGVAERRFHLFSTGCWNLLEPNFADFLGISDGSGAPVRPKGESVATDRQ